MFRFVPYLIMIYFVNPCNSTG